MDDLSISGITPVCLQAGGKKNGRDEMMASAKVGHATRGGALAGHNFHSLVIVCVEAEWGVRTMRRGREGRGVFGSGRHKSPYRVNNWPGRDLQPHCKTATRACQRGRLFVERVYGSKLVTPP